MTLHLTRAVLNRDAGAAALAPVLDPPNPDRALDAHHRLIWTLFPGKDAERDFLWRADGHGRFFILSHRVPTPSDLFRPLDTTAFTPNLVPGDPLSFVLRANATKDRRVPKDKNGRRLSRRVDLVMDALHGTVGQTSIGSDQVSNRPGLRMKIADRVAADWLAAQGRRNGFTPGRVHVEDYSVRQFSHGRRSRITFGLLDMAGTLEVTEPDAFLAALGAGFGRARAFGCGLMLIRRA